MPRRVSSPFHIRYAGSWLALGLLRLLCLIPMPVLFHAGTVLGDLLRAIVPSRRRIAERNIALCFPDRPSDEIRALARENILYKNLGSQPDSVSDGTPKGRSAFE